MDPISIGIELELGALLLAVVGGFATWLHDRHVKSLRRQRERHHLELKETQERQHREKMSVLRQQDQALQVIADEDLPTRRPTRTKRAARPKATSPAE